MTRVLPFVGTRFNPNSVEDLSLVMAPPYDVISPRMQDELLARSPFNIVHLDLGKDLPDDDEYNNRYQRAASHMKEWRSKGVLIDDPCRNFYIYQQEFRTPDNTVHIRTGIFAAIHIEDPAKGKVRGHEQTFEGPKADRLKLLRTTKCNLSPIFCLYSDPEKETDALIESVIRNEPPRVELTFDEGVIHRLWLLSNIAKIRKLSSLLQDKQFYIADGHHRYETAARYCREMARSQSLGKNQHPPYTYVLSYLTNCESDGIVILPTHRVLSAEMGEQVDYDEVVSDLEEHFEVRRSRVDIKKPEAEGLRLMKEIAKLAEDGSNAFAMVLPGGKGFLLRLKKDATISDDMREDIPPEIAKMDVSILHEFIIAKVWVGNPEIELDDSDISYVRDASDALKMLNAPWSASAVFIMNAPKMSEVVDVATKNLRMPHKTTYFYPKLLTGLVIRDLNAAL